MPNRSREEIVFAAHLIHALGLPCTAEVLERALQDGARDEQWDLYLNLDGTHLSVDYDGHVYHQEDRVERDHQKTMERLQRDPKGLVLRVRSGPLAAPLDIDIPERCAIVRVHTKMSNASHVVSVVAPKLAVILQEPFKSRLVEAGARGGVRNPVAREVAYAVIQNMDARYRQGVQQLKGLLKDTQLARKMMNHRIHTALENGELVEAVTRVMRVMTWTPVQITTAMQGLASHLLHPQLTSRLGALQRQMRWTPDHLVTAVSNRCFSANIFHEDLLPQLRSLQEQMKWTPAQMATAMSSGLAGKIFHEDLLPQLRALQEQMRWTPDQLVTAVSNGLAGKIFHEDLLPQMRALQKQMRWTPDHLVTAVSSGCLSANIFHEDLLPQLGALQKQMRWTPDQLATAMSKGLAGKIFHEDLLPQLRSLQEQMKWTPAQMTTAMSNNSFSANIFHEDLLPQLRSLQEQMKWTPAQMTTAMSSGLAGKIFHKDLLPQMRALQEQVRWTPAQMTTAMSSGLAGKIFHKDLLPQLKLIRELVRSDKIVTLGKRGLTHILKPAFVPTLKALLDAGMDVNTMVTFVSQGGALPLLRGDHGATAADAVAWVLKGGGVAKRTRDWVTHRPYQFKRLRTT